MRKKYYLLLLLLLLFNTGCSTKDEMDLVKSPESPMVETSMEKIETPIETLDLEENLEIETPVEMIDDENLKREEAIEKIRLLYGQTKPSIFGENIPGVYTRIKTDERIVALTFDACGGQYGSQIDEELIAYLIEEEIPSTLFINSRWMEANKDFFLKLSKVPFFDLQNHGTSHKPLSTVGESIYGITGTKDLEEVLDEVLQQQENMKNLIQKTPRLFRSGTAYYDDVAIKILDELGIKAVNFSVLGDAGATYSVDEMMTSAMKVKSGDIFLYHMNHPEKKVAQGIKQVIPMLREKGYSFVKLSDYEDKLE